LIDGWIDFLLGKACWINCFYETVLGPHADTTLKPSGSQTGAMDVDELATAWVSGFKDTSAGGCEPCPASGPCPGPDTSNDMVDDLTAVGASPARRVPRPYAKPRPSIMESYRRS